MAPATIHFRTPLCSWVAAYCEDKRAKVVSREPEKVTCRHCLRLLGEKRGEIIPLPVTPRERTRYH